PIPGDILIDIFSRVPGKSVARFRCVSKFWASLLRRPDFTELFLTKSLARPRLFFNVRVNGKSLFYSSPQPQNPDENSCLVATRYNTPYPEYFPYDMFCNSSICGLVLLCGWSRMNVWVICNPATGEFLTLPKVKIQNKHEKLSQMYLGYDPIGKQFKVLCMTSSGGDDERPNTHQVLTSKSGKRFWRRIEQRFRLYDRMDGEVCINGVLYFGGARFGQPSVVCFDVRSEKFSFINTNEEMGEELGIFAWTLFNYKGKVGIHDWNGNDHHLVCWVLEDAVNHKWSKHKHVLPDVVNENMMFVGMTSTGDIMWSLYNVVPSNLYIYSMERKTITSLNIQGEEFKDDYIGQIFVDYVENMKFI
ncbi:hypothetical protein EUTSA_v10026850mg, partial [Eutrema salsugineum]